MILNLFIRDLNFFYTICSRADRSFEFCEESGEVRRDYFVRGEEECVKGTPPRKTERQSGGMWFNHNATQQIHVCGQNCDSYFNL